MFQYVAAREPHVYHRFTHRSPLMVCNIKEFYDVIVIGAGLSGLVVAHQLMIDRPELKVMIFEAKDHVGGRILTKRLKTSNGLDNFDLGGQWVSNDQYHIMRLLVELGLDTYPQYEKGKKLIQFDDGKIIPNSSHIPKVSWLSAIDIRWFIIKFRKLVDEIDADDPNKHPEAHVWDSMCMETYNRENLYTDTAKQLVNITIRTALGVEPSRVSVLAVAALTATSDDFLLRLGLIYECRLGVRGGCSQICERLAEKIGMENIRVATPITCICQGIGDEEDVTNDSYHFVRVLTEERQWFAAQRVVVAIPPHFAAKLKWEPTTKWDRMVLITNLSVGNMTKYVITYAEAFWRSKGFSGEIMSTGGPKIADDCDNGPLSFVLDATSSNGNPALVGILAGNQEIQWMSKSFEMRKMAILKALSKFFGKKALKPLDFAEKNWTKEPFNEGCNVNIGAPGTMLYMTQTYQRRHKYVYWAGTEMAIKWRGYMSGAVEAGKRVADAVRTDIYPYPPPKKEYRVDNWVYRDYNLPRWPRILLMVIIGIIGVIGPGIFFYLFEYIKKL